MPSRNRQPSQLTDKFLVQHCQSCVDELGFFTRQTKETIRGLFDLSQGLTAAEREVFLDSQPEKLEVLWSSLLMDSIHALKLRDQREKAWHAKYYNKDENALTTARAQNAYGITSLKIYFNAFTEYERVLYGAEGSYRDHVTHVIRTWLIGIYIMTSDRSKIERLSFDSPFNSVDELGGSKQNLGISKEERWAMWTIIALGHDLGYPLEKTHKINTAIEAMLAFFGNITTSRYTYSFQSQHQSMNDIALNLLSSKVQLVKTDETTTDTKNKPPKEDCRYITKIQEKYHAKFAHSLEEFRHGIISCLVLVKSLVFFLETDYENNASNGLSYEDARQFFIRRDILRAIAAHTCTDVYHLQINTLAFLLIVCDELQEWGRPTLSDMKLGRAGSVKSQKITIDQCDFESGRFEATIVYNGVSVEELEKKLKRKFQDFHKLMRAALDDKNRKIEFVWTVKSERGNFVFKFNSNNESFNELSVTKFSHDWDIYEDT